MKFKRLVSTGCGYMQGYAHGQGHVDLAQQLGIAHAHSLSMSDSSNARIFRTVHADSLQNKETTLYVIGLTFLGRWDMLLNQNPTQQEGRWTSFQNQQSIKDITSTVLTSEEFSVLLDIKIKTEEFSIPDRIWDLSLTLRALIDSLKQRSHGCVIFNTAEDLILPWLDNAEIKSILEVPEIVKGLKWLSVPYQFDHGVAPSRFDHANGLPAHHKHTNPGEHDVLNAFLVDYINTIYDTN